jgi:uncharacterized membrane protein YqjE
MERIKAIATIVVTAVVNIANVMGYAMDADVWLNAVLSVLSAISIVWSWWKNQNITDEAQQAQLVLNQLKNERKALQQKGE